MPVSGYSEDEITLNFVNAEIEGVIKTVSHLTGKNFLVDPRIKGTINIISANPLPKRLAYDTLLSALRMQGFTVVESRGLTRVTLENDAKVQPGPVDSNRESKVRGEQIITRVFKLNNESAAQAVNVIRPLMSPNMAISTTQGSNMLIVTDSAENLNRIDSILQSIDVPTAIMPVIVHLKHITATDASNQLSKVFAGGGGPSAPGAQAKSGLIIVPESKSNRLILRSDDGDLLRRAQTLLAQIDKPESSTGNIHVIPIKNSDAVQLANTLRTILAAEGSSSGGGGGQIPASIPSAPSSPNGQGTIPSFGQSNTANALVGGSSIQADVASNSLIVTAPQSVYQNLLQVIEVLDRRRSQVYLEVLIAEINSDKAAEMGFQWQALNGLAAGTKNATGFSVSKFGDSSSNIGSVSANPSNLGNGFSFGVVKGQTTLPGVGTIANIGLLARFLETESQANILSAPNILTLDNEEAQIIIGQNVPFTTGSYTNSNSGSTNPFQTYERKDVGLTLKVKPQITAGGVVMINIFQEVSSVQSGTAANASGPTTNKRSLQSKILVDDGNMIILGGLIENSTSKDNGKIPLIGSIPVLGNLFRYDGSKNKKTNLMVFIRPTIIRDSATYNQVTAGKYQDISEKQNDQIANSRNLYGDKENPLLPMPVAAPINPQESYSSTSSTYSVNNPYPAALNNYSGYQTNSSATPNSSSGFSIGPPLVVNPVNSTRNYIQSSQPSSYNNNAQVYPQPLTAPTNAPVYAPSYTQPSYNPSNIRSNNSQGVQPTYLSQNSVQSSSTWQSPSSPRYRGTSRSFEGRTIEQ